MQDWTKPVTVGAINDNPIEEVPPKDSNDDLALKYIRANWGPDGVGTLDEMLDNVQNHFGHSAFQVSRDRARRLCEKVARKVWPDFGKPPKEDPMPKGHGGEV